MPRDGYGAPSRGTVRAYRIIPVHELLADVCYRAMIRLNQILVVSVAKSSAL